MTVMATSEEMTVFVPQILALNTNQYIGSFLERKEGAMQGLSDIVACKRGRSGD